MARRKSGVGRIGSVSNLISGGKADAGTAKKVPKPTGSGFSGYNRNTPASYAKGVKARTAARPPAENTQTYAPAHKARVSKAMGRGVNPAKRGAPKAAGLYGPNAPKPRVAGGRQRVTRNRGGGMSGLM